MTKESTRNSGVWKEEPRSALGIKEGFPEGVMPERHLERVNSWISLVVVVKTPHFHCMGHRFDHVWLFVTPWLHTFPSQKSYIHWPLLQNNSQSSLRDCLLSYNTKVGLNKIFHFCLRLLIFHRHPHLLIFLNYFINSQYLIEGLACSVAQSCSTLWPHGLQHTRLPCPSPIPWACSNSCPLSQWCHPTISSSVVP